jgi:hypothetical protein
MSYTNNTPHRARVQARLTALALGALAFLTPGCGVVEAPFTVIDTVLDAPFKVAQTAIDTPFKPITEAQGARRRKMVSDKIADQRYAEMKVVRDQMIAEGKLPPPKIGPDGQPIYTKENFLVPISPFASGKTTSARTGYKSGAQVSNVHTPIPRPLPPSMGVAIPVPRNKAEKKAWKKNGAPQIVQYPGATTPGAINYGTIMPATNAGAPGSGTVTFQPSISAPTRKPVYTGPGQEPRTDLGAIR